MIRRFLCWLGWHDYEHHWTKRGGWIFSTLRCPHCGDEDHLF